MGETGPILWRNPKKLKKGQKWRAERRRRLGLENTREVCEENAKQRSLVIRGHFLGQSVSCLLDTGSTISLISSSFYRKLPKKCKPSLTGVTDRYSGVDGGVLTVLGKVTGEFQFGLARVEQELIVADIEGEVILGMDFLMLHECQLDLSKGTLQLHEEEVRCWDENEDNAHFRVVSRDQVSLPPHSSAIVIGRIKRIGAITPWGIIEPNRKLMEKSDVMVGRTVVSATVRDVPVRVHNCSHDPVVVHQEDLLGWCESVEKCEDAPSDRQRDPGRSDVETVTPKTKKNRSVVKEHVKTIHGSKGVKDVPDHLADLFERGSVLLTDDEKTELAALLCKYSDVFSKDKEDIGRTSLIKHEIDTGETRPIKQAPRRLPFTKRNIEREEIEKMKRQGIIEPSVSPWASPVVLVTKKDGTTRFCIDYRKVNAATTKDAYPLPRIDDCLDSLAGSVWFSTLDLNSGYWQVEMEESSKAQTAFVSRSGLFQFKVMPFGLANAPSTFERLMEETMRGLQWEECLIYLDDIISFGKSFQEEIQRLTNVFDRLRAANLKLKPKKCHLFQQEVEFLGFVVSREGIATLDEKIEAVREWPVPENLKELRSFLGLCSYYRKFVQSFASLARPLQALVKKDVPFEWKPECQQAFQTLKEALTNAPVLAYPLPNEPFILDKMPVERRQEQSCRKSKMGKRK